MKNDKTKHKSQKFPPTFLLIFELGHFFEVTKKQNTVSDCDSQCGQNADDIEKIHHVKKIVPWFVAGHLTKRGAKANVAGLAANYILADTCGGEFYFL